MVHAASTSRGFAAQVAGLVRGSIPSRRAPPTPAAPSSAPITSTREAGKAAVPSTRPRLSIVVLPFANLSNDPEQEYFVDGITDDLTTDLSRLSGSFVIARNTAFTYKGKQVDAKQIGHELGVNYILEGSVRRVGDEVRVNVQLIDGENGAHLWADRFDTDRANLAAAQDEITGRLARALKVELVADVGRRIDRDHAVDPDARDLVMRGRALLLKAGSVAAWQEAVAAFERALEIDPRSVDAQIGLATALGRSVADGWSNTVQQDLARAEQLLLEALADANSASAHAEMGRVRRLQNRLAEAKVELETAIALDRNLVGALRQLGQVMTYLGQPEAGIPYIEKALLLSPRDSDLASVYRALGVSHLLLGHVDQAVELLSRARAENPRFWYIHYWLAAALGLRGELDEARAALAESIRLNPEVNSLSRQRAAQPWGTPQYWSLYENTVNVGLRRAGFPDGMTVTRRLAAVLAADVAGYSRLMGVDEEGTHERLKAHLQELVHPKIAEHRGRIVKNTGDGFLAEFPSVVDAVRCAAEVQRGMAERNAKTPENGRITFRIGINLGDVIVEEYDIFGDGVNVAARLEALAEPGGICISRVVRDQVRDRLDCTFEDLGEQEVKNIPRPVRAYRVRDRTSPATGTKELSPPPLLLPDKPSIAVLPFQNMSGDPEQEYFADGMVEEITTALSRIRWLFVIARNSSFTYKGQAVDVKQVGRELGVCYVLEGSVRKAGGRLRITTQLIDAQSGAHLWADRFDGALEDVFDLQDQIAISVAGVIEPALEAAEVRRSAGRPTKDLTAYDLYLRALATYYPITRERIFKTLELLQPAIVIDRHYGPALSWAAMCHMRLAREGWAKEPEIATRKAVDLARRAVQVAQDDPGILANASFVLASFGEEIGAMMGLVDRALKLTPSFARGWFFSGVLRLWAGQPDLSIVHTETSLRLSPRERMGTPLSSIGEAYWLKREFDKAVSTLLLSIQDHPGFPHSYRILAACYVHMGRLDEARDIVKRLRAISPVVIPSVIPYRNPDHRELFLSGLRLAAGETE